MGTDPRQGYVAISRAIFDHPLFKTSRPYSRLEAWEWLINAAAWKAKGHRWRFGVLHLDRGQLATSIRELATIWKWTKSSVHRFLRLLNRESMVALADPASGTRTGTPGGTLSQRAPTIITICNYDKFQLTRKRKNHNLGHEAGHEAGHETQEAFDFMEQLKAKPLNHSRKESRRRPAQERRQQPAPSDGEREGPQKWVKYGTDEWHARARDFREVRGIDIFPEHRRDGAGNYFYRAGEAARPSNKKAAIR